MHRLHRRHRLGLGRRRRHRGRGLMDFLNKAHNFVKSNQLISRGASALAPLAASRLGKYGGIASNVLGHVANAAGAAGYGRRRRRMHRVGYGLRLAGM